MIIATIILGVIALLGAYAAGITQTWTGTAAASAFVLLLVISALPSTWWLFDSATGWFTALALWSIMTVIYHNLLSEAAPTTADHRRSTPAIELKRRHVVGWQFGRYTIGIAVGVTA